MIFEVILGSRVQASQKAVKGNNESLIGFEGWFKFFTWDVGEKFWAVHTTAVSRAYICYWTRVYLGSIPRRPTIYNNIGCYKFTVSTKIEEY